MIRQLAHVPRSSFALALLAAAGLSACSKQGGDGTSTGDSVLVTDAQHVVWRDLGGGNPPFHMTELCGQQLEESFDFDLGGGSLSWSICMVANGDYGNPAAYSTVTGSRVLAAAERTQATDAARAVKVTGRDTCGADLPTITLEVATPSDSVLYGDDFYACQKMYAHYVDSVALDQLGEALRNHAHNP